MSLLRLTLTILAIGVGTSLLIAAIQQWGQSRCAKKTRERGRPTLVETGSPVYVNGIMYAGASKCMCVEEAR